MASAPSRRTSSFALRLQGGIAEVRESGAYKSETSFQAGDTLRIAVENGTVKYSKNGAVFYTSANRAGQGLRVHAVFFDVNATIGDVTIGTAVERVDFRRQQPVHVW